MRQLLTGGIADTAVYFSPRRRLHEPEAGLEALRAGLRLVKARSYASERSGAGGKIATLVK